ncbi:UNVERIFIED_CONTAM: Tubulin-tyrosine ligase family protein [Hammondia hammondi]|eukprot:XP_008887215.1 Tubulin-tyrosine ligase family protein [Hammondia hammondi]
MASNSVPQARHAVLVDSAALEAMSSTHAFTLSDRPGTDRSVSAGIMTPREEQPFFPRKFAEHPVDLKLVAPPNVAQMALHFQNRNILRESGNSDLEADTRGSSWSTAAIGSEYSTDDSTDNTSERVKQRNTRLLPETGVLVADEPDGLIACQAATEGIRVYPGAGGSNGVSHISSLQANEGTPRYSEEKNDGEACSDSKNAAQSKRDFSFTMTPNFFAGDNTPRYHAASGSVRKEFFSGGFSPSESLTRNKSARLPVSVKSYGDAKTVTVGLDSNRKTSLTHTLGGAVFSPRDDPGSLAIHVAVMNPHAPPYTDSSPTKVPRASRQSRSSSASAASSRCKGKDSESRVRFKHSPLLCSPRPPLSFNSPLPFRERGLSPGNNHVSIPTSPTAKSRVVRPPRNSGTQIRRSVSAVLRQAVSSEEGGGNRQRNQPLCNSGGTTSRNRGTLSGRKSTLSSRPLSCPPRRGADHMISEAPAPLPFPSFRESGQAAFRRFRPGTDLLLPSDDILRASTWLPRHSVVATPRVYSQLEKKCLLSSRGVRAGRSPASSHSPKMSSSKKMPAPESHVKSSPTRSLPKKLEICFSDVCALHEPLGCRFSPSMSSARTRKCPGSAGLRSFETELKEKTLNIETPRDTKVTLIGPAPVEQGELLVASVPAFSGNFATGSSLKDPCDLAVSTATANGGSSNPQLCGQPQIMSNLCQTSTRSVNDNACGSSFPGDAPRHVPDSNFEGLSEESPHQLSANEEVAKPHVPASPCLLRTSRKSKQKSEMFASPRSSTDVYSRADSPSAFVSVAFRTGTSCIPKQSGIAGYRRDGRGGSVPGSGRKEAPDASRSEVGGAVASASSSRGGSLRSRPPVDPLALAIHHKLLESGIIPAPLSLCPRGRGSSPSAGKRPSSSSGGEPSTDPWQLIAAALSQATPPESAATSGSRTSRWIDGLGTTRGHYQPVPFTSLYAVLRRDHGLFHRPVPSSDTKSPWESGVSTSRRHYSFETTEFITHDGIADACRFADVFEDADLGTTHQNSLTGDLLTTAAYGGSLEASASTKIADAAAGHTSDGAERSQQISQKAKQPGRCASQNKTNAGFANTPATFSCASSGRISSTRKTEALTGAKSAARPGPGTKLIQKRKSVSPSGKDVPQTIEEWQSQNDAVNKKVFSSVSPRVIKKELRRRGWVENPDGFSKFFHLRWLPNAGTLGQLRDKHRAEIVALTPGVEITPSISARPPATAREPRQKKGAGTGCFDAFDEEKLMPYQIVNKFPDTSGLTTRVGLLKSLRSNMPFLLDKPHDAVMPRSFILTDEDEVATFREDYVLTRSEAILKRYLLRWACSLSESYGQSLSLSTGECPTPNCTSKGPSPVAAEPAEALGLENAKETSETPPSDNPLNSESNTPFGPQETPEDEAANDTDCSGDGCDRPSQVSTHAFTPAIIGPEMDLSRTSLGAVLSKIFLLDPRTGTAATNEGLMFDAVKEAFPKLPPQTVKAAIYAVFRARAHISRAATILDCSIISETELANLEKIPLHLPADIDLEKAEAAIEALLGVFADKREEFGQHTTTVPFEGQASSDTLEDITGKLPQVVREAVDALRWLRRRGREQWSLNGWSSAWVLKSACISKTAPSASVCHHLADIQKTIRGKFTPQLLIQKLVERPLTVNGKTFDIRVFVLVTSWSPLSVWMYQKALVRVAEGTRRNRSGKATTPRMRQQGSSEAVCPLAREGEIWSSEALHELLQGFCGDDIWRSSIYPQMRKTVTETCQSVQNEVVHRARSLELFAFDFLVDSSFKPWLLEVTKSPDPGSGSSTRCVQDLASQCLCDSLKVILDWNPKTRPDTGNFELIHVGPPTNGIAAIWARQDLVVKGSSCTRALPHRHDSSRKAGSPRE